VSRTAVLDLALRALAGGVSASLLVAGLHDVSKAWDTWYYHLPFAARLVGLVGDASYRFSPSNQARFEGFPLLGEAVQGALWRLTGRPESASLLCLLTLPALALVALRLFSVPLHVTVLALLAVPLVQIHATSTYVDLPANACVAVLALLAYRQVVQATPPPLRVLGAATALATAAANTKFQVLPLVLAAAAVLVATSLRKDDATGRARLLRLTLIGLSLPVVMATPLKNLVVHGNPVWPVALGPFPHLETAYASSPVWLEEVPRPVRFVASVLEVGLRPVASHARWSLDQWTPPSDPAYRMGGFFGVYVIVNVAALILAVVVHRTREARVALAFAGGATLLVSFMPQSHELRYYLAWMLLLILLNLAQWWRSQPMAVGVVATVALGIVAWSTGFGYLYASGDSFAELVAAKVDPAAVAAVPEGGRVCVSREPWSFLHAARFHAGRHYSVQEADRPEDCAGAPPLGEAAATGR